MATVAQYYSRCQFRYLRNLVVDPLHVRDSDHLCLPVISLLYSCGIFVVISLGLLFLTSEYHQWSSLSIRLAMPKPVDVPKWNQNE